MTDWLDQTRKPLDKRTLEDPYGNSLAARPGREPLLHYSTDRGMSGMGFNQGYPYSVEMRADKPGGLWVSVGTAWREWREAESWGVPDFEWVFRVELKPSANILYVETERALRNLYRRFPRNRIDDVLPFFDHYKRYPSWPAMKEKYDGIVIAPYQWECRLDEATNWYYGWDCASGCIWNLACVKELHKLETLCRAPAGEP